MTCLYDKVVLRDLAMLVDKPHKVFHLILLHLSTHHMMSDFDPDYHTGEAHFDISMVKCL